MEPKLYDPSEPAEIEVTWDFIRVGRRFDNKCCPVSIGIKAYFVNLLGWEPVKLIRVGYYSVRVELSFSKGTTQKLYFKLPDEAAKWLINFDVREDSHSEPIKFVLQDVTKIYKQQGGDYVN